MSNFFGTIAYLIVGLFALPVALPVYVLVRFAAVLERLAKGAPKTLRDHAHEVTPGCQERSNVERSRNGAPAKDRMRLFSKPMASLRDLRDDPSEENAVKEERLSDPRDDVEFLEWMQRYVGFWSDGEIEYGIRRREDGWLQGWRMTTPAAFVPAVWVIEHAHKTGEPPGPLGMRPILVTESLARYWFSSTPNGGYPGSIHVSRGREIIVEAVEQKMREADVEATQRFWRSQWAAWPRKALDADDVALDALLRTPYQDRGTAKRTEF